MTLPFTPPEKYFYSLTPEQRDSLINNLSNETPQDQSKIIAQLVREWERSAQATFVSER